MTIEDKIIQIKAEGHDAVLKSFYSTIGYK